MSAFDFIQQSSFGSGFVYKNTTAAYAYNATSFTATTGSGTTVMEISEVTQGTVIVGMTITGGTLSGTSTIVSFDTFDGTSGTVNLSSVETWTDPTPVSGQGFIEITDAQYPPETVRGIVYLNGTYYVMTPAGSIYGSDIENPFSWSALNVIQTLAEPDPGVCLSKQGNLIVAFGTFSTEFFYDAANPVGSPLLPYSNTALQMGCASAGSVTNVDNNICFMSVARQKGRSISLLVGTVPQKISTTYIDRILDADDLALVNGFYIKVSGHAFYILELGTSAVTLVYDFTTGFWHTWTVLRVNGSEETVAEVVSDENNILTLEVPTGTFEEGTPLYIKAINGTFTYTGAPLLKYNESTDVQEITIPYNPDIQEPALSGDYLINPYVESQFRISGYSNSSNLDLVQDSTTGTISALTVDTFQDNGNPIPFKIRTPGFDGGDNKFKLFSRLEIIGDKVDANLFLSYSNDDYQTWSEYRPINLNNNRSQLNRLGRARRRAFEMVSYEDAPIRLRELEMYIEKGYS